MSSVGRCAVLILVGAASACDPVTSLVEPEQPAEEDRPVSAILGHEAFLAECANCHASQDGFDLAFFSFPDSTIVRRALGHVDAPTADDIVAYIRTLMVDPVGRFEASFQPGGEVLADDLEFAMRLFGADAWPSGMTTADLLAIAPTQIPVAIAFPRWSVEESNVDWMPDGPFPEGLLRQSQNAAGHALTRYRETGSDEDLRSAVGSLRWAAYNPNSTVAPCAPTPKARFRPDDCFQARRWTASLIAQHMLRSARTEPMYSGNHDAWWGVGHAAFKSMQNGQPIENAEKNQVMWMYMGWAFAPQNHSSWYLAGPLLRKQLPRHATFHSLRAQVSRVEGGGEAYSDLDAAVFVSPRSWVADVTAFSLRHLIGRIESGDVPSDEPSFVVLGGRALTQLEWARRSVQTARNRLYWKLEAEEYNAVNTLFERVLELLPPQ